MYFNVFSALLSVFKSFVFGCPWEFSGNTVDDLVGLKCDDNKMRGKSVKWETLKYRWKCITLKCNYRFIVLNNTELFIKQANFVNVNI